MDERAAGADRSAVADAGGALSAEDGRRISAHGLTVEEVERQLALLRHPPEPVHLLRPAVAGDGIRVLGRQEEDRLRHAGREAAAAARLTSFVPASGAASRMFRVLLAAREHGRPIVRAEVARAAASGDRDARDLLETLDGLERFAFIDELERALASTGHELEPLRSSGDLRPAVDALLAADGLDCASKAKGQLAFHRYAGRSRTAFEEHLVEAAQTVRDRHGVARVHFTVSPHHRADFAALLERIRPEVERRTSTRFEVRFSEQRPSSDTVAINADGAPFRDAQERLLFRPGGHGALLENLNELDADLLLIKNIDNIVPDHLRPICIFWKQVLAGLLVETQAKVFAALDELDRDPARGTARALALLENELDCPLPAALKSAQPAQRLSHARKLLERPIRVCGMVPASGETGGGPFWVRGRDGRASLQIVETAQIDVSDPDQAALHASATHFNPVDLACSVRDRHGRRYDLRSHVDPEAAFITEKSSSGRSLRALEHPGLWNGAMADWTTVFVEVPLATFNPVKTVNDLLRREHQPPDRA
jgi:Domain of unknown function (DUF4301)